MKQAFCFCTKQLFVILLLSPLAAAQEHHRTAQEVFDLGKTILFQDDFRSGSFAKWRLSENDDYGIVQANPQRIQIVDAPGLGADRKAVRFAVHRGPNSFRSEISLPYERGFQERWYGERILIPQEWVFDPGSAHDIVMQWHAIPGNGKATYPNLQISVGNTHWFVRQSYGSAQDQPTRTNQQLADLVQPGCWVSWVIHAKWSPGPEGLVEIWKDHHLVLTRKGPNVYSTIGEEYTPYFKTGIYHPEWHLKSERQRKAFAEEHPTATHKIIDATDIKVGSEKAKYEDVAPR